MALYQRLLEYFRMVIYMSNKLYDMLKAYEETSVFFSEYAGVNLGFWDKLKLMILHPIQYYNIGKAAIRIKNLKEELKEKGYWVTEGEQTNGK